MKNATIPGMISTSLRLNKFNTENLRTPSNNFLLKIFQLSQSQKWQRIKAT